LIITIALAALSCAGRSNVPGTPSPGGDTAALSMPAAPAAAGTGSAPPPDAAAVRGAWDWEDSQAPGAMAAGGGYGDADLAV
jgi:hypothetical protein